MRSPTPIIGSEALSFVAAMPLLSMLVIVHALAATVWTGGHLVLGLGVLPRALRARDASLIRAFEEPFEPLGLGALAIQVVSGLWMATILLPGWRSLFHPADPMGVLVAVKLLLLALTVALALHARLRLIPHLRDDNLAPLAWHIRAITVLAVAFVVVGAGLRLGGFG
jgi:putative copper export protein